jgi:hypothetical protein
VSFDLSGWRRRLGFDEMFCFGAEACVSAEVLSVVEARRFRPCGLAVVAALAQAAHALRVVGVQACFDELDAFDRPMVGYGAGGTA